MTGLTTVPKIVRSIPNIVGNTKQAIIFFSLVISLTIVDSQFINIFYGTEFGNPTNFHLLLFVSLVIIVSVINTTLLIYAKRNDAPATTSRPLLLRIAYLGTCTVQYTILTILAIVTSEMLIMHDYNKIYSILIVYLSHLWAVILLGALSLTFIQWFKFARSFSIVVYAVVFIVILFLFLVTIPLLTEQFSNQFQLIYPRSYTILIENLLVPSPDIAFIYGIVNYVLPVMIISSWTLTVSLLKSYSNRIGKKIFWLMVSIPLVYQLFTFLVKDTDLLSNPALFELIYSKQFQFIFAVSYQISGAFFATAFLFAAIKIKRRTMKNYLIISSLGILCLFSSMQPGMPFYAAYPPFGLVSLLFLGLSSYMLLIGMLGIAANVSRDAELRKQIYKGLEVDSDILKNMGMAETQREIERRIMPLSAKIRISEEMNARTDPSEEEVRTMIDEVLTEIQAMKSPKSNESKSK